MPLKSYGVLSGAVVDIQREGKSDTPHYQIELADDAGVHYRLAVNVESQQSPSELRYCVVEDFKHPITDALPTGTGWTPLPPGPDHANLDFIRANLFDPATMRLLPPDVTGPDNDLADLLDHYVLRAQHNPDVRLYAFGERWGPEDGVKDKIFGFLPGNGVHDIHMNQGNGGAFTRDNGVWQDGGLLLHFASESRWVAIFLAFQSQSWHTDDRTGNPIDGGPDPQAKAVLRIVGSVVNPIGPSPEAEHVTLLNASPAELDLAGWQLADKAKRTCPLPSTRLAAGATLVVPITNGVQLGNHGGAITVLDPQGLKVDGVSYTGEQADEEGWTLVF